MSHRRRGPDPLYFDGFRTVLGRAPAGLLRPGPPAAPEAIAAAEAALDQKLPRSYAAFLGSFDGADLFHESVLLCGVGPQAPCDLTSANRPPRPTLLEPDELVFGESGAGDKLVMKAGLDDESPVFKLRAGSEERWLVGSDFPRWLDATIAREQVLYGPDGEFLLEAFEPDGEELTPSFSLRQAERALKKDPGSAESHHDLGVAFRRLGRLDRAREAFLAAGALDATNPWPHFDLGRVELSRRRPAEAAVAFRGAARLARGPEAGRLWTWAARAALEAGRSDEASADRREAEVHAPDLPSQLRRAAEAAGADDDEEARTEAQALLAVFEPALRRLPVIPATPIGSAAASTPAPPRRRQRRAPGHRGPA